MQKEHQIDIRYACQPSMWWLWPHTDAAAAAAAAAAADAERKKLLTPSTVCDAMAFRVTKPYSAQLRSRVAWLRVLKRAQAPAGGGWAPQFDAAYMTSDRLGRLSRVIDDELLHGQLRRLTGWPGGAELSFAVEECDERGVSGSGM
jgi:hypothetical protein